MGHAIARSSSRSRTTNLVGVNVHVEGVDGQQHHRAQRVGQHRVDQLQHERQGGATGNSTCEDEVPYVGEAEARKWARKALTLAKLGNQGS